MREKFPLLSIVMPVYNEEEKIESCLKSIRMQDYPQDKIEIVFVDDDSKDNTLKISKKYKIRLVKNGAHDYDIGKSLGIKAAKGEFVMFLDADNIFPAKDCIKKIITPLLLDKSIIGSQPIRAHYRRQDPLIDRYSALFGITDPLTIYLKKRSNLIHFEKEWRLGVISRNEDYSICRFTKDDLPTIGSVGFTIRKKFLLMTNYSPAFSHLDSIQDLLAKGLDRFAMVDVSILHLHAKTYKDFKKKLVRNLDIFIRDFDQRRYKWDAPFTKKAFAALAMVTFVIPLYHSLRGFLKIRDPAWFLHPFICFNIISTYLYRFSTWKLKVR